MEKHVCMAEPAIFVQSFLTWVVMMLESSLGLNFLHACLWCSSSVHDGVHEQQVPGSVGSRHLQVINGDQDDEKSAAGKVISKEELEVVLGRMGLCCGREGQQLEHMSGDEFSGLFEEEPSLEEVKEAFCVFDENSDGFIDAAELQRVLRGLGLAEGSELEACRSMIRRYDRNQDGKLDFMEFVRVMEISFNC